MGILTLEIKKAGTTVTLETDELPEHIYELALKKGLESMLNARMSKVGPITKLTGKDLEDARATAQRIADENLAMMRAGKLPGAIRKGATKRAGVNRIVSTEALRLAKDIARDRIRDAGRRIQDFSPAQITAWGKMILETSPQLYELAKANIEKRQSLEISLDALGPLTPDPAYVEKAKAKQAKAKAPKEVVIASKALAKGEARVHRGH